MIHAKGMTQMSLEFVDSDSEMTEDGCWLFGWPGLDYFCKADWIHRLALRTVGLVAEQWMDS